MKLTVQKEKIIEGLQKAASILPAKAGAAYLRSIWLKAQDNALSIMATDVNLEFTGVYPANVEVSGLVGVQGRTFVDLVKQLPNGDINLSLDDSGANLLLEQGRRSYRLSISSKEWFQELSPYPGGQPVTWTGSVLSEYLDRIVFCISDDDMQDALNCLYFKPRDNGRIDMCGLNGHQFALMSFIYEDLCQMLPQNGLMLQKKYLADLRKWLIPDEIEINLTDKRIYLRTMNGGEMLSLPHASYDYPDYNIFMNKLTDKNVSDLRLPRKEAIDSLGRLQVFNTEADRCVHFGLHSQELDMSVQGSELGSAREGLEAEYAGSLEKIAFPTKHLLEIFGHFNSENLNMKFTGEEGPCGITGPDDMNYTVIIMPMKVASASYYEE